MTRDELIWPIEIVIALCLGFAVGTCFTKIAHADPPPAPVPPPEIAESLSQHYIRWEALCPTEAGTEKCWVYVVRRRQKTACSQADIDGNGSVGVNDFVLLGEQWGCTEPSTEEDKP